MVVDDYSSNNINIANHSLPKKRLLPKVLEAIKNTPPFFVDAVISMNKHDFNEDELTSVFVNQNQAQINRAGASVRVGEQYRDIYHKTKGLPDIYYSFIEEGKNHEPIFVMEAKRLPAPEKNREKEYVTGKTANGSPNGGIERFKLGKHGKGLVNCGMLAYIETNTFGNWLQKVNKWILELAPKWTQEECLTLVSHHEKHKYYISNTIREQDTLRLHHFWIGLHKIKK